MKEIVEAILKEEEEARRKIEKARIEGQDIILKAQKDSLEIAESSLNEVNAIVESKKRQALEELNSLKAKVIGDTRDQLSAKREAKNRDIPAIAQKIFSRIIEIN